MTIKNLREQIGALVIQLWEKDETIEGLASQLADVQAQVASVQETAAEVEHAVQQLSSDAQGKARPQTEPTPIREARRRPERSGA
jgi:uncharacterized coiled-coil protein SlyX